MKYLAYDEYNDQEIIIAKSDKEAMTKALKLFGITILKLNEDDDNKKRIC